MTRNRNIKILLFTLVFLLVSTFMLGACTSVFDYFKNLYPNETETENTPIQPNTDLPNYIEEDTIKVNNATLFNLNNVLISNNAITWDKVSQYEKLYAVYFSNSTPCTIIEVDNFGFTIPEEIANSTEIYAFRIGIKQNDEYILSKVFYYNPIKNGSYTSFIYYFNGKIHDHYISSQEELNHIMHYSYIYRRSSFYTRFSKEFKDSILLNKNTNEEKRIAIETTIIKALNSFLETSVAQPSYQYELDSNLDVKIMFNFKGAIEPTKALTPSAIQDSDAVPYYENYATLNYTIRDSEYDNFATDNNLMLVPVVTSEELFWAVESGATPIFENTTSSAYKVYQKAKDVLRQIIKVEMTDYEKVLSIFDYIVYNTIYDWKIVASEIDGVHPYIGKEPITMYTSFYLEGVFEDGIAVCDGFSKAFSLLCNMEGIKTVRIVGKAGNSSNKLLWGGHAWNKVYLNKNWYVVDPTWTEIKSDHYASVYDEQFVDVEVETLMHRYFLISDSEISKTHEAHSSNWYKNYSAPKSYYAYVNGINTTYTFNNDTKPLVIASSNDVVNLISYLWTMYNSPQQVRSVEVIAVHTLTSNQISSAIKQAKQLNNFNNDILTINASGNFYYDNNKIGSIKIIQIKDTFYNLLNKS